MSKYVPVGLILGALLGSTAFLAPVAGFAQGAPAATPPQTTATPAAPAKPGPATAEDKEKERADHKAFLDAKLAGLHAGLELTAAQAPLWTPVEAAIRGLGQAHEKEREAVKDSAALSPLDRLKHHSEWLGERAKGLKTLTDATSPLVASLDATQKEHLPKLLEGSFKGHKLLYAAFNVPSADEHEGGREGGHEGARDEHKDGDEDHHAWHHEHEDGDEGHHARSHEHGDGDEEHHWHHHHHHHHHWGHHHWDHDEADHEHHEHHGDHDRDGHAGE